MARGARRGSADEAVSVTDVRENPEVEIRHRQRRYLFSMALRTVCFVGAIVTHGWVRWVLVAGALVLPYVAVVMANVASPLIPGTKPERPDWERPQLPPGPTSSPGSSLPRP